MRKSNQTPGDCYWERGRGEEGARRFRGLGQGKSCYKAGGTIGQEMALSFKIRDRHSDSPNQLPTNSNTGHPEQSTRKVTNVKSAAGLSKIGRKARINRH